MSFVIDYNFGPPASMDAAIPPSAPSGFSPTVSLEAGRYFVTGDLTVYNEDSTTAGTATCKSYVNNTAQDMISRQSIIPFGYGNLAISGTFDLPTGGSTIVDFRCYKEGLVGGTTPTVMWYYRGNMTIYKVG